MRLLIAGLALCSTLAHSHQITVEECQEGAEFISNAALLRDSGRPEGTEEAFVSRAIEELEMIQAFPPELRWFAQDQEDAEFLIKEILEVWRDPQEPTGHYQSFLNRCTNR